MAWEQKLMRTVRVRNTQARGVLANLLTAISESGGDVGGIEMLTETSHNVVRDITVYAEDEAHIEKIIEAMRANEGTKALQCVKVTLLASLNGYAPAIAIEFGRKVLYSTERPTFLELEEHVKKSKR